MSKKVYLSPSDQDNNAYAYGGTNEAAQCGRIADACRVALVRSGVQVKVGTSTSMATRCAESDKFGADLHVPIHTNAYNGKVSGTRVFCYDTKGDGYKAAKRVYSYLAPLTPGTSESISANPGLFEIKTPAAPTVYCECEFHDVAACAKWIIEHTVDIGEAIAHGICDALGVAYKAPAAAKPAEPVASGSTLYRVQVGAYSVKENAEAQLKRVKAAGFADAFITEKTK